MVEAGANPNLMPREVMPGVFVCPNPEEVARAAARRFVDWAWQAIAKHGRFNVALSGGSTPRELYRLLATSEYRLQIDWPLVQLYWGDERAVPPDHPESNYGMVRRELLLRAPIPQVNVHRMEADDSAIGRAAHNYESLLRRSLELDDLGLPRFHLILLGMGADGHTASLFPGTKMLRETNRWVSTPVNVKQGMRRMTLTLPVLEAAYRVLFLVTGKDKAATLKEVLCGDSEPVLPAAMVKPRQGERVFLIDEAAASLLPVSTDATSSTSSERA